MRKPQFRSVQEVSVFPLLTVSITVLLMATLCQTHASINYTVPGSTYSQNFDTLPNSPENVSLQNTSPWIDDSATPGTNISILGWYLYHPLTPTGGETGINGHQRFRISPGTSGTGSFYSFGSTGSNERALGDIGSTTIAQNPPGNQDIYIGLRLSNNTGVTLDSFTLSYNGEQWRNNGNNVAQDMIFMWSTSATAISDTNTLFTTVAPLGYSSPVFSATAAAVDGNSAGRVVVSPVTVTGVNWQPGTDLWLRWDDLQNSGNDHALAIDDVSFTAFAAVPEPSTYALIGLSALGLLIRRRAK